MSRRDDLREIADRLDDRLVGILVKMGEALLRDFEVATDPDSDIATPEFTEEFSARLLAYHAFHAEKLTKKTFEFLFRAACRAAGREAEIVENSVNPGEDLTVDGTAYSLKTEGAKSMSVSAITISKLMEARWIRECATGEDFAENVRARVGGHLSHYERVLTLRAFDDGDHIRYELIEIPIDLLRRVDALRPADFQPRTANGSSSADVVCEKRPAFKLSLDGSVEKVTIRNLKVDLCRRHAVWKVDRPT